MEGEREQNIVCILLYFPALLVNFYEKSFIWGKKSDYISVLTQPVKPLESKR